MDAGEIASVWFANLVMVDNKPAAISINIARSVGVTPARYSEIVDVIETLIESTSGPAEFWEVVNERRQGMHFNDAESVVFGSLVCSALILMSNSILYGKKLAEVNHVDYNKLIEQVLEVDGICI